MGVLEQPRRGGMGGVGRVLGGGGPWGCLTPAPPPARTVGETGGAVGEGVGDSGSGGGTGQEEDFGVWGLCGVWEGSGGDPWELGGMGGGPGVPDPPAPPRSPPRVRLSKRRARAGVQSGTNAVLVVKHRDMNEKELEAQVQLWGGVCDGTPPTPSGGTQASG